ncbi:VOC family protein [Algiphilus sp. NNCM1]|uniref:VOC family protein n=1 Tax=Algiphilus sp. TaxID=1872431 RepID=UPI001CA6787E|nr:VOC family protein [Algiphilus sp.]MBY8966576.1 VOC family protein [Algiphilus acroporae]MCI5061980.1 VOC family protein [Algiphilus sp.]MCI5103217.1 VOC family protein [Algiphilus sp.]
MPCPFHLALAVDDLAAARAFYGALMGCPEGRSATHWVDFDFFGHQLVVHHAPEAARGPRAHNAVEGDAVPVPHFGVVLPLSQWHALAERLQQKGVDFVIAPHRRFAGTAGEQGTFFLQDPAGNALEFKGFADVKGQLFAQ